MSKLDASFKLGLQYKKHECGVCCRVEPMTGDGSSFDGSWDASALLAMRDLACAEINTPDLKNLSVGRSYTFLSSPLQLSKLAVSLWVRHCIHAYCKSRRSSSFKQRICFARSSALSRYDTVRIRCPMQQERVFTAAGSLTSSIGKPQFLRI